MKQAGKVIEKIVNRGIDWFDVNELNENDLREYRGQAEIILNSPVFKNELNRYITDLVKFCAYEAMDFDSLMNVRASIVALESFRERLEQIQKFKREPVDEEVLVEAI